MTKTSSTMPTAVPKARCHGEAELAKGVERDESEAAEARRERDAG